jgi:archaeal flagellar protein FlaJ
MTEENIRNLKDNIGKGKGSVQELRLLMDQYKKAETAGERKMISSQINLLKSSLKKSNEHVTKNVVQTSIAKPLPSSTIQKPVKEIINSDIDIRSGEKDIKPQSKKDLRLLKILERATIKRLKKKKKKKVKKKEAAPSSYVSFANKIFASTTNELAKKKNFKSLERSIVRAKLPFIPASYLSVIFFTTVISFIVGIFLFAFFLFFNFGVALPIITRATGDFFPRFIKVLLIPILLPVVTFLLIYFYPSMEEKSAENKINSELPFATIHMSSIAGSMIDPSNIFKIIISTKEYPFLEKEFTKLMNEINVYGYDLVTALKNIAYNSPSRNLSELFTGLATTINSGGNLQDFFDKRAETLLFDYKIQREKYAKSAETMMDVYISVVIAAPMIFMLLMMMMSISGLGLAVGTSTITIMTILGVVVINIVFLTFLHLKQPS